MRSTRGKQTEETQTNLCKREYMKRVLSLILEKAKVLLLKIVTLKKLKVSKFSPRSSIFMFLSLHTLDQYDISAKNNFKEGSKEDQEDVTKIQADQIEKIFGKTIQDKLDELLEEKIHVFDQNRKKDIHHHDQKTFSRPYVNAVKIKLYKDKSYLENSPMDDNFLTQKSNFAVHEQTFRITESTTFKQLKE